MTGIALIADKNTVACFKLAGLNNVHTVKDAKEAEKSLKAILEKNKLKILIISERILNKIQIFEKIVENQTPLIIPIPDLQGPKTPETHPIVELIKRKTGIEVKF